MKHPIRRRFMYLAFQGLRTAASLLPLSLARTLGRGLGLSAYWLLRGERRLALDHLAFALGHGLAQDKRRSIVRQVFINLGQNAMEWFKLPRLSEECLEQLIDCKGLEHLRAALAGGRGVIMLTGHFGNWELIPSYLRSMGFEGSVVARHLRYPEYESFLIKLRERRGVATIGRGSGALKEIANILRKNQIVGMMPDQDIDSVDGIFVDFFGHPAYTPIGPAALSLMTGASIVPCFIIREGSRFRMVIEPVLAQPDATDRSQAIHELTQVWSDVVEAYIRRYPDHWVWMHRRWKTQSASAQSDQRTAQGNQVKGMGIKREHPVVCGLVVAGLALLATLMGGCSKSTPSDAARTDGENLPLAQDADESITGFTLTGYRSDGSTRWELRGEGATVDRNIVTILRPDGTGYDPKRTTHLTASLAQVNQDNRYIRMEHDVNIHTSDGLWFTTPILYWIPDKEEAITDERVRIETDHMLVRGRGLRGHSELKYATILKDVELLMNPSEEKAAEVSRDKHVRITCDGPLTFDYERNIATFEENVHVKDPSGDLYSDKLIAYLNPQTHTIRYAEAIGSVKIYQEQNTAHSERAVYEPNIGKITLLGRPSLLIFPSDDDTETEISLSGLPGGTAIPVSSTREAD